MEDQPEITPKVSKESDSKSGSPTKEWSILKSDESKNNSQTYDWDTLSRELSEFKSAELVFEKKHQHERFEQNSEVFLETVMPKIRSQEAGIIRAFKSAFKSVTLNKEQSLSQKSDGQLEFLLGHFLYGEEKWNNHCQKLWKNILKPQDRSTTSAISQEDSTSSWELVSSEEGPHGGDSVLPSWCIDWQTYQSDDALELFTTGCEQLRVYKEYALQTKNDALRNRLEEAQKELIDIHKKGSIAVLSGKNDIQPMILVFMDIADKKISKGSNKVQLVIRWHFRLGDLIRKGSEADPQKLEKARSTLKSELKDLLQNFAEDHDFATKLQNMDVRDFQRINHPSIPSFPKAATESEWDKFFSASP